MGIISLNNTDKLFWLGRYSERVYTTIRLFGEIFDRLIDEDPFSFESFCTALDIPCVYASGEDFVERYLFDPDNPDSVLSNLTRAYDNAVTLREEIGSECVSYIQLAMYSLNRAHGDQSPLIGLQQVMDSVLAFWGLADDLIADENVRNIIKTGKRVERLDLYARLKRPASDIQREVNRLSVRVSRTTLRYDPAMTDQMKAIAAAEPLDYRALLALADSLVSV